MSRICIVLGLVLAACAAQVPLGSVEVPASELYCFTADVTREMSSRAICCFDRADLCNEALVTARRYGAAVGVRRLTACERWSHIQLAVGRQ